MFRGEKINLIMKKVTVYITTKNRPEDFSRALDSVINQTYSNLEIIVVDDGSSPVNSSLNKNFCSKDNRVVYVRNEESVGAPAARNIAISLANGFFVTGLDDDDFFEIRRVELFVDKWNELNQNSHNIPVGFLYSQYKIFTSKEKYFFSKFPCVATSDAILISNCVGNQIFAPLENWFAAGLFDEKMPAWQDLELFYRFCKRVGCGILVNNPSYVFFDIRSSDRISTKGVDRIKRAYNCFLEGNSYLSSSDKAWLYMQIFSKYYGFRPSGKDVAYFFSLRPSVKQILKFLLRFVF